MARKELHLKKTLFLYTFARGFLCDHMQIKNLTFEVRSWETTFWTLILPFDPLLKRHLRKKYFWGWILEFMVRFKDISKNLINLFFFVLLLSVGGEESCPYKRLILI